MNAPRHGPAAAGARGFSLLEILVAITIFAVIACALFEAFGAGLRNTRRGAAYARATTLAQSLLVQLGAQPVLVPVKDAGISADGYRWNSEIRQFGATAPGPVPDAVRAFELTVEVHWQEGSQPGSVALSTLELKAVP